MEEGESARKPAFIEFGVGTSSEGVVLLDQIAAIQGYTVYLKESPNYFSVPIAEASTVRAAWKKWKMGE